MAKPQKNTPVPHIISLLAALPDWHRDHAAALVDGLDEGYDAQAALTTAHSALKQSQDTFERERKEDQQATIHVDVLLSQGEELLGSLQRTVLAVLRKHPQRARLTRQFIEAAPSQQRSAHAMLQALKLASAGLKQHSDLFAKRQSLHTRLIARADQLITLLDDADKARKKEQVESRAAGTTRDAALLAALDLITELDDAAQSIYFDEPAPYNTLRTLYAVHCPEPLTRNSSSDDEPSEDTLNA